MAKSILKKVADKIMGTDPVKGSVKEPTVVTLKNQGKRTDAAINNALSYGDKKDNLEGVGADY